MSEEESELKPKKYESLSDELSSVLVELVVDSRTPEHVRMQIINKLLEEKADQTFFDTMLEEELDMGDCPHCGHTNRWLIPEEELNQRGIITADLDNRVKKFTTASDCTRFEEACAKKKVSM